MKQILMLFIFALFINVSSATETDPINDETQTEFTFGDYSVDSMVEQNLNFGNAKLLSLNEERAEILLDGEIILIPNDNPEAYSICGDNCFLFSGSCICKEVRED